MERGQSEAWDDQRKVRIAQNEVLFREVNERVREVSAGEGPATVGFLCEWGNDDCTDTVYLTVSEYEDVRSDSTQFVVALETAAALEVDPRG